jgi:uncharacterized RDD family membrane protein YckC
VVPVGNSAAAPALEPAQETGTVEQPPTSSGGPARQAPLFDDRPKIIPFESITGRTTRARKQSAVRRELRQSAPPAVTAHSAQQPLDLRAPAPRQKQAVSDDVPVAKPGVRLRAAMLDGLFTSFGIAAAAAIFYIMGGRFVFSAKTVWPYAITAGTLALFYQLFWCVLGVDSAGTRVAGLRVLTFDGHAPAWGQRIVRFVLACFDVVAVGIGVLWALIDDEGLTWHDHISKTFPTEYDANPSTVRRR